MVTTYIQSQRQIDRQLTHYHHHYHPLTIIIIVRTILPTALACLFVLLVLSEDEGGELMSHVH